MTTRRRERPWCRRTRNVADELASSVTFFNVRTPLEVRRWTSTNLPANERAAVTLVETAPLKRLTSASVIIRCTFFLVRPDPQPITSWAETGYQEMPASPKKPRGQAVKIL